ncbi:MAG: discoidin domain-containing protein [Planctomycetota bacterium]
MTATIATGRPKTAATVAVICVFFLSSLSGAAKEQVVTVQTEADSEAVNYESYRAMDGDPETMWHTQWEDGETAHPHELTVDLGSVYVLTGFHYLPRVGGGQNGTIKAYEVYVSSSREDFGEPVLKGTFSHATEKNEVSFPEPLTGRYFKLRALSEVNGKKWASVAELKLLGSKKGEAGKGEGDLTFRADRWGGFAVSDPKTEIELQYEALRRDLKRRKVFEQVAPQAFHTAALIHSSDRDPADVVLRRTKTLLGDIRTMSSAPDLASFGKQLSQLESRCSNTDVDDGEARFALYKDICSLRREIAFSNPLLNFDEILFLKRHRATFNHMCDQYYGINARPGGGLFVLSDPFGPKPTTRDILDGAVVERGRLKGEQLQGGSFLSPDLSHDADEILFAYVECEGDTKHRHHTDPSRGHWHRGRCYHVFKVNVDGSGLQQLTDGTWNDFDPCWLPNGRVAFISERRGGYLRCGRVCPTYTLYDMNPDGSDILWLSPHETNEWHPSVTHGGMIIYTRWDYIDRHGCVAHLPWITTPDGRDSRAVHGNFAPREQRADMELDIRAIPGSDRFVATGAPHHGQAFGSLVMFDSKIPDDDAMAPVQRLTPEIKFPETEGGSQVYGTAWPLSETYYLCVYDPTMGPGMGRQGRGYVPGNYGIYLLDVFGNKELLYRDPEIACQNPMPLRPRKKPPVVPVASERHEDVEAEETTIGVIDVYDSLKPWPAGTEIKELRVYQIIPMSTPSGSPPHETGLRLPTAQDSVNPVRHVLGTVPVEEDGSAYFKAPPMKELFFQAIDEKGLAVQSMRSATYVQPGEKLVCQGCHEPKQKARKSPETVPLAFRRGPSTMEPDVEGSNPFSYPRLVQPVLDNHCLECHEEHPDTAPRLDREVVAQGRKKWYASYFSLAPDYGFWKYGDRFRTTPGEFGARASKLYELLQEGHHDVDLSSEEMHRITLWLDSTSLFYGVYEKEGGEAQLRGEIAQPTLE